MTTVFFDCETRSIDERWRYTPREYFRLGQWAEGWEGKVHTTTDIEELKYVLRNSTMMVGHNIHNFDLSVIFGQDSIEPLEFARDNRVFDTWTACTLLNPAPYKFTDRNGREWKKADKPGNALRWFGLDNQCYQLGVEGKIGDLRAMAKKYGGYDRIPLDDPEFLMYAEQDVISGRSLADKVLKLGPYNDYAKREQLCAAIDAQNMRNGFRVDPIAAQRRVEELDNIRDEYMSMLIAEYDMPSEGKAPLRTNRGKIAITRALNSVGISLDDLPRTKDANGAETDRPSFGGQGLKDAAIDRGDEAEALCGAIAAIGGLRPLAQSALDNMQPDGMVHVNINTLQRSGRKSTTDPGLTIWTSRGTGQVEKAYFVPDAPDHVLCSFDMSQADARIVAAYSGDKEFAKRFAVGVDAHMLTAELIWGYDVVHATHETEAFYRQIAKACGHAYAFRAGARRIALTAKVAFKIADRFVKTMQRVYKDVTKWQEKVTREGKKGYVINAWGRKMRVDKGREYNQAPALYGQSGTRELINDALIRMPNFIIQCLKAQVHDALVFSFPKDKAEEYAQIVMDCMTCDWGPPNGEGQVIHFPCSSPTFAENWMLADASH